MESHILSTVPMNTIVGDPRTIASRITCVREVDDA
jgi:hypothetical protein